MPSYLSCHPSPLWHGSKMEVRNPQVYREIYKTTTKSIFLIVTSIIPWTIEQPATYTRLRTEGITMFTVCLPLFVIRVYFDTILTSQPQSKYFSKGFRHRPNQVSQCLLIRTSLHPLPGSNIQVFFQRTGHPHEWPIPPSWHHLLFHRRISRNGPRQGQRPRWLVRNPLLSELHTTSQLVDRHTRTYLPRPTSIRTQNRRPDAYHRCSVCCPRSRPNGC